MRTKEDGESREPVSSHPSEGRQAEEVDPGRMEMDPDKFRACFKNRIGEDEV